MQHSNIENIEVGEERGWLKVFSSGTLNNNFVQDCSIKTVLWFIPFSAGKNNIFEVYYAILKACAIYTYFCLDG